MGLPNSVLNWLVRRSLVAVDAMTSGGTSDDYEQVVIIGASLENAMYGNDLTAPHVAATAALGNGIPVYGCATSGMRMAGLIPNVQQAIAAFPTVGETLFVVHPTGNDITSNIEYGDRTVAELDALRSGLDAFLDEFGEHLPHVIPVLSSFRAYWGMGYATRELFNAQEKGAAPFNNLFWEVYAARTQARWRVGGSDALCFYDWIRNSFMDYLTADGIHLNWEGATETRAEQMRRLRLLMAGMPDARIVPVPADPPAPAVFQPATITPSAGLVGQAFDLGDASFYGAEPMTITGQLLLGATDVTSQIVAGQYTSTAAGTLTWRSTGSNGQGPDATSEVTATVSAEASEAPIFLEFKGAARAMAGLNTVNVTPANEGPGVGPLALIDGGGGATAVTYQLTRQGGGNFSAVGINPTTWTTGTAAWDGTTIWATEVFGGVWYLPFGQVAVHTLRGLEPGASYQFNLVGSRMGSSGRITTYAQGATSVTLDPNANPPQNVGAVFTADAGGEIRFTQTCNTGWSYVCGFSLRRAAQQNPLQPYYDNGTILIHLSSDGAVLDGSGAVTAIDNAGGAGATFDATVQGNPVPISGDLLQMSETTGTITLANAADLVGVRLMWVSSVTATNGQRYFGSQDLGIGGADYEMRLNVSGDTFSFQLWDNEGGTGLAITPLPRVQATAGLHLFEMNFDTATGVVTMYQDGVATGSVSFASAFNAFLVDRVGQGVGASLPFVGTLGDVMGVVLGAGSDAAINAARAYLAGRYPSLTLA